jgi:tetratricopeptide (TPR) repeat protein
MVPMLADVEDDHPTLLDLLPSEWEVLAEIDGVRDLRGIATALARSEFDVGKVVYGLATTGVIELRDRGNGAKLMVVAPTEAAAELLEHAGIALRRGELDAATDSARAAVEADPHSADAHRLLARALILRGQHDDAVAELKRALQLDASDATVHLDLGFCAASRGDFAEAEASWDRYLRLSPHATDAERVRAAMETVSRLRTFLTEHLHV